MLKRTMMASVGVVALLGSPAQARSASEDASVPATPAGAADQGESGDIVVTANKRSQSIYNVASSISTVDTDTMTAKGMNTLRDLTQDVPGLAIFSRGSDGANLIILRGLSSGSQTTSPTVGVYVNDTPFSFSIPVGGGSSVLQPDLDPSDIERIEVLRGPQGTLYGASTLGGLIKYVTRKPDATQLSGSVQDTVAGVEHGGIGNTARAAVNMPLVEDRVALRVSGFYRLEPGFIDNSRTGQNNVNETRAYGGRASLGLYPTDNLSIVVSGLYQKNDNRSLGAVNLNPVTLQPSPRDLTQQFYANSAFNSEYRLVAGQLSWKLGDYTLSSSTSSARAELSALLDFTSFLPPNFLGAQYYLGPQDLLYTKFSQEVRLTSPAGKPLEWVAGLFYTSETVATHATVDGFRANGTPGPLVPRISQSGTDADFHEYAAFANVTYNITPTLALTGGVRVAHSKITDQITSGGLVAGAPLNNPLIQHGRQSADVQTWLASLNWRYAHDGSFYIKAASGYRPGGPVEPPPVLQPGQTIPSQFNADTVWNFEAGNRNNFLDGRVSTDVSVFYIRWNDIQLPYLVNGIRVLANGGKAISQGVEFLTRLRPAKGFSLSVNGSYTDAHLTTEAPLVFGHAGDRLPFVPRWNVTANADYETPISGDMIGKIGATYHYQSGIQTALSPADTSFIAFKGFSTADARLGVAVRDIEINAFIRNAFDKRAYVGGGFTGGLASGVPIQPRTIGVGFSARF